MTNKTNNMATGTVEGTGSAININCGFKPTAVKVINADGKAILDWTTEMGAAYGVKTVDSGTGTTDISLITSGGITQLEAAPGPVSLTGTGSVTAGDTTLTGSGSAFTTQLQKGDIVNVNGQTRKVQDITSDTVLNVDLPFDTTVSGKTMKNMSGTTQGFTIGADSDVNASAETIYWMAFR